MKAIIKVCTAKKEFTSLDLDAFRRSLNVFEAHGLSATLTIKKKVKQQFTINQSKLKAV